MALTAGLGMLLTAGIVAPVLPGQASARVIATTVPFSLVSPAVATDPSVSANGQFIVFTSAPGTADGRTSSVWLSDQSNGQLTELSLPNANVRLGNSIHPVISADGCVVVMTTEIAYDLFRDDDTGSRWDIYRTTLPACGGKVNDWTLVSTVVNADGVASARDDVNPDQPAAVSGSGSVVAYVRPFRSLSGVVNAGPQPNAIDVVDLTIPVDDPHHTVAAAGLPTEVSASDTVYSGENTPALSADGSILTFSSDATSDAAVPDWGKAIGDTKTAASEIYAWNRTDANPFTAVQLVSTGASGAADASAVTPTISSDGRYIAFSSAASNLVSSPELTACASSCLAQVYLVDRDTDANQVFGEAGSTSITLVSAVASADGSSSTAGNGASFSPSISADGTALVFASQSSNLLQLQTPGGGEATDGDLIIADLVAKSLDRAFASPAPAPGAHAHPHISGNSRVVVADTLVADRLTGDPSIVGRHVVAASYVPSMSMADIDLGTVMVSIPGPEWFVNIVNSGPGSFVPATITTDNPDFAISGGTCADLTPIAAGQSCSIMVILTPSVPGPVSATLTVAEAGYGAITLTSSLQGAGGEPALEAKPTTGDVGTAVVGHVSDTTATFAISNIYVGPTTVTSVTIAGADPDDFAVTADTCIGDIPIGADCNLTVSFTPTADGRRSATVNVSTSFGQYTSVLVGGTGVYTPQLVVPPTATPGRDLAIGGTGFPVDTGIVIAWNDGTGRAVLLTTDGNGNFLTNFPVSLSRRPGAATLVAQVPSGPSASGTVQVDRLRPRPTTPPGARR
ncbi:MAG: hypothetical protein JWM34_3160 [Ilumatobacteraceae bacterium]|nr:hypothetical protein [Ilumatobacteraceae bacterium]